ncbi:hypothetical protein [Loktanella salsilacus]|uniref:hypothetical protein n=1 Tax=Loktanella salsilacus TaxID=195913 RepID=UPI0037370452
MKGDALDPAGLIREAYLIDGITAQDCRVIFLDWAIKSNASDNLRGAIQKLLTLYADQPAHHPMTQTLRAGLDASPVPKRRGGRAGRHPAG